MLVYRIKLKAQLARHLNPPRVIRHAVVDAAEDGGGDDGRGVVEGWIVQDVARIETKIEIHALGDPELLRQRRVPLKVVRREEEIAARIADRTRNRRRELTARRRVEPEVASTLQHQVTTVSRAAVAISSRLDHAAQDRKSTRLNSTPVALP